jgi:hypothetical protein
MPHHFHYFRCYSLNFGQRASWWLAQTVGRTVTTATNSGVDNSIRELRDYYPTMPKIAKDGKCGAFID